MKIKTASYKQLEEYFAEVESKELILQSSSPTTIFDISGFPHYENVISNWYAFFLDYDEDHKLKRLFLDALFNLIDTDMEFETWVVERETSTDKGSRIDLCIIDKNKDENIANCAIIIENKITAELNNDLKDYYDSIKSRKKKGVYLTMEKDDVPIDLRSNFVNITHSQWMESVKLLLGDYILDASDKYVILLKDFIQNFENMSSEPKNIESIKYYFDHAKKVNEFIQLKKIADQYLIDQVYRLFPIHNCWNWARVIQSGFSFRYKDGPIIGYVYSSNIYKTKSHWISFWINSSDGINKWEKNIDKNWLADNFGNKYDLTNEKDGKSSLRIARLKYTIENFDEIENFGKTFKEKLETDWESFIDMIDKKLTID